MDVVLLFVSLVIFACIGFQYWSGKIGVPGLFLFIVLGMLCGSDGIFKIPFSNYEIANQICSFALIFIMFYGGAGTKWSAAKPVALKAIMLSGAGTFLTAGLLGAFCHLVLGFEILESFLVGAVICSTDAASVFSILRSKKMNLKYSTASLLEVESGSNDPFSYMLTVVILSLMNGDGFGVGNVFLLLFKQVSIGIICGFTFALLTKVVVTYFDVKVTGLGPAFAVAVALISYSLPTIIGGNGYLSVYITGIIVGNIRIPNKKNVIQFFDGITGIMQMLLFFLLGLLSYPSQLPGVWAKAFVIAAFLTFVARPAAVFVTLLPFKCKIRQLLFVSWSGMRGVASIVFAIMAVNGSVSLENDLFHIVFFIVLFSILVQGTLLPTVARRLNMIDSSGDVMKTFTDYADEVPIQYIQFVLNKGHDWVNKRISQVVLPPESILVLIIRNGEKVIPRGDTRLLPGDTIVISGRAGSKVKGVNLVEKELDEGSEWVNKRISEVPKNHNLIVMVKRNGNVLIPRGNTVLNAGDILVINKL